MRMRPVRQSTTLLLTLLTMYTVIPHPALAKEWVIDYSHSHLGFVGSEGKTPFQGGFKNFTANVDFDPAHPDQGTIKATIDIASITAGSTERDSYLPQGDWFNTKAFPQAQFASTHIHQTGADAFVADGNLTIKDVTRPVSLPFTLKPEGDHWRATGKLPMLRTDFHIGQGDWSNEDYVKRAVDVVIDLSATPKP